MRKEYTPEEALQTSGGPIFLPDPNCTSCHGSGFISLESGAHQRCTCLLRQHALHYLTPTYASANYFQSLNVTPMLNRNLLLEEMPQSLFKQTVKSFLLNTAMKLSHMTCSGYEVIQGYLTNRESNLYTRMQNVDLLILYLVQDPRNRSHAEVMIALIEHRILHNLPTWVYTQHKTRSESFTSIYQIDLHNFLTKKFQPLTIAAPKTAV